MSSVKNGGQLLLETELSAEEWASNTLQKCQYLCRVVIALSVTVCVLAVNYIHRVFGQCV